MPRPIAAPFATLLLAGCVAAGPDYPGPPRPAPLAAGGAPFANAEGGAHTAPAIARWWEAYDDPLIDTLMREALAANRSIAAARARLAQAQALVAARRRERGPTGSADAGYARTRPAIAAFGVDVPGFEAQDIDLFDLGLSASWELDLAGGQRRAVEAALAEAEGSAAALADVRLSILNRTVQAYCALRAAQAELALVAEEAAAADGIVRLVEQQRALGAASDLEVEQSRSARAQLAALVPALEADAEAALAEIAVLTGRERAALGPALTGPGAIPQLALPVRLADPGAVIRQRPDIRAAERRLAAATADIGVAAAELFPRISLLGNIGFQANAPDAFGVDSFTYGIGPLVSWSFPDRARIRARIAQREGKRDEVLADYEATVLAALGDVETALARHRRARQEMAVLGGIARQAAEIARLTRRRYDLGTETLIAVLQAERDRLAARRALAGAETRLAQSHAVLSTALGLGWEPARPSAAERMGSPAGS